jgi:Fe-S cluster biogenesis protein NfuA
MYGKGATVPHEDIAVVSGIAIPCAADMPAYILSIAPSDLHVGRLLHSRAIGGDAIMVVDCKTNQSVKVDVKTGVLPKDKELNTLRAKVIARKRAGTADEHRRFFDVLEELITEYVERGDDNFDFYQTDNICWPEFQAKLSFAPAKRQAFRHHLVDTRISPELTRALVELDVLDEKVEAKLIHTLTETLPAGGVSEEYAEFEGVSVDRIVANTALTTHEKVQTMIAEIIAPVLENDGGRLELVEFLPEQGEVSIRFVGSCANCPCSMLSLENIVKPPLLRIAGVTSVVHRGLLKSREDPTKIALRDVG